MKEDNSIFECQFKKEVTNNQTKLKVEDEDESNLEYYGYLRTITENNQMAYWIGNPSVEIVTGSIILKPLDYHQEREPQTFDEYAQIIRKFNVQTFNTQQGQSKLEKAIVRERSLIVWGIPNTKTPAEVLESNYLIHFIPQLLELKVVKTDHLKYYSLLMLFNDRKSATKFYNQAQARQYNQIEIQKIIVRQIQNITVGFSQLKQKLVVGQDNCEMEIMRKMSMDRQEYGRQALFLNPTEIHLKQSIQNLKGETLSEKKKSQANNQTCPICLEQMTVPMISLLCGHYFDVNCLQKWQENTCPLCRYHQQPPVIKFCQLCSQCEGLWVCLVCGIRLCCGLNNNILAEDSHIYLHYRQIGHSLAMQLQTKFIFDAKVPAFLHQMFYKELISNKSKKQVKQIQGCQRQVTLCDKQQLKKNKLKDKISFYQNQVWEEMDKQRNYFQTQLALKHKHYRKTIYQKKEAQEMLQSKLKQLSIQEKELAIERQKQNAQIQKIEKELKIVADISKIKQQKIQQRNQSRQEMNQRQNNLILQLEKQIKQRRIQLQNFKQNLNLKKKIKQQLGSEQIGTQCFLVNQKNNKKKKQK